MTEAQPEHPLEIYRSGRAQRWPDDALLDGVLLDLLGHELMWAVRPVRPLRSHLLGASAGRETLGDVATKLRLLGLPSREAISIRLRRRFRPQSSLPYWIKASLDGGLLRLWRTENQRLALFGFRAQPAATRTLDSPPRRIDSLDADALDVAVEAGRRTAAATGPLLLAFAQAESIRNVLGRVLDEARPSAVLTASTEHPYCRLTASVCRAKSVPSIYVPHAPTAVNRNYADIPQDRAYLRGEADRDYYLSLGANPESIQVVGDPMFSLPDRGSSDGEPIIVLSTGVDRPLEDLANTLEVVRDAQLERFGKVVVCPHPRGRREVLKMAPRFGFDVAQRRTSQVLAENSVLAMLVERSSGVTLEALASGVPVLLLSASKNYLFEVETDLPVCSDSSDLARAVGQIGESQRGANSAETGFHRFVIAAGQGVVERITQLGSDADATSAPTLDSWRWQAPSACV